MRISTRSGHPANSRRSSAWMGRRLRGIPMSVTPASPSTHESMRHRLAESPTLTDFFLDRQLRAEPARPTPTIGLRWSWGRCPEFRGGGGAEASEHIQIEEVRLHGRSRESTTPWSKTVPTEVRPSCASDARRDRWGLPALNNQEVCGLEVLLADGALPARQCGDRGLRRPGSSRAAGRDPLR